MSHTLHLYSYTKLNYGVFFMGHWWEQHISLSPFSEKQDKMQICGFSFSFLFLETWPLTMWRYGNLSIILDVWQSWSQCMIKWLRTQSHRPWDQSVTTWQPLVTRRKCVLLSQQAESSLSLVWSLVLAAVVVIMEVMDKCRSAVC